MCCILQKNTEKKASRPGQTRLRKRALRGGTCRGHACRAHAFARLTDPFPLFRSPRTQTRKREKFATYDSRCHGNARFTSRGLDSSTWPPASPWQPRRTVTWPASLIKARFCCMCLKLTDEKRRGSGGRRGEAPPPPPTSRPTLGVWAGNQRRQAFWDRFSNWSMFSSSCCICSWRKNGICVNQIS